MAKSIPATPAQQQAMARQARELYDSPTEASIRAELVRRADEKFAFSLYASLRSPQEILDRLQAPAPTGRNLSRQQAQQVMERVSAIVASWRDARDWHARRDQMILGLLALRDEHLRSAGIDPETGERITVKLNTTAEDGSVDVTGDPAFLPGSFGKVDPVQRRLHLIEARACMDQISKIEGHYSPLKVQHEHTHAHAIVDARTLIRQATPSQRSALRALLGKAAVAEPIDADVVSEATEHDAASLGHSDHSDVSDVG